MNRFLKKLIFGFTLFSLLAITAGSVLADGGTELYDAASDKSTLSIEFLGTDETPKTSDQGNPGFTTADATANKAFWIGVAADNLNKFDLFTQGVYSLEIAFEYDSSFVRPTFIKNGNDITNNTAWNDRIKQYNNTEWNSDLYDIVSVRTTDIDTHTDRENIETAQSRAEDSNWKMCTVCVRMKSSADSASARFKGIDSADKQYLIKLPFILVGAPKDNDPISNPTVLCLVQGPETFDIGSDTDGTSPQASWRADNSDTSDLTNLKNIFDFKGDISLFGSGGIEDIVPFVTNDDGEQTFDMNTDKDDDGETGFSKTQKEYYVTVPNEVDNLKLHITVNTAPTVTVEGGDNAQVSSSSAGVFDAINIPLKELDITTKDTDFGFNNKVVVNGEYTIYIRRLIKPKIELNYGNSPVGLIMRDDETFPTKPEKEEAIQAFDNSHTVNKRYGEGKVPKGGQADLTYVTVAWRSYTDENGEEINYDLNPYSLFVYEGNTFKDPGCTIYDEEGEEVVDESATVTINVKRQMVSGVSNYDTDVGFSDYSPQLVENTTYSLKGVMIRMDVYFINYDYRFTRSDGSTIDLTEKRPLIVLGRRGDIFLNEIPTVNDGDVDYLRLYTQKVNAGNSLVAYRCMDLFFNEIPTINDGDVDYLRLNTQVVNSSKQYYSNIE